MSGGGAGYGEVDFGPNLGDGGTGYMPGSENTGGASGLGSFGAVMMVAGALNSAIGGFYSAKSQQYQLRSQALNADFQAGMASLSARAADIQAQSTLRSGQQAIGLTTMRYGQEQAARKVNVAARGLVGGVGSVRDVAASAEYAKQADVFAINTNAVQAAEAARMQSVNYANQAQMSRISAENMRRGARSINPWLSATSSLLGSAGPVASNWAMMSQMGAI